MRYVRAIRVLVVLVALVGCHPPDELPRLKNGTRVRTTALDGPKIAAGSNHTCAVSGNGKVYCWGDNGYGQLGQGHINPIGDKYPADYGHAVPLAAAAEAVWAGADVSCARLQGDKVQCWGRGGKGQLGYPRRYPGRADSLRRHLGDQPEDLLNLLGPIRLPEPILSVHPGANHTCARGHSGKIYCFGDNTFGVLGYDSLHGPMIDDAPTFGKSVPIQAVDAVAVADRFVCVLRRGTVNCWGALMQYRGRTHGTNYHQADSPKRIKLPGPATRVVAADASACAQLATGEVYCWGALGTPQRTNIYPPKGGEPRLMLGGKKMKTIAIGAQQLCGVTVAGDVICNRDIPTRYHYSPTNRCKPCRHSKRFSCVDQYPLRKNAKVRLATRATDIAVGVSHACAQLSTNRVQCWGQNERGQLGYGDGCTYEAVDEKLIVPIPSLAEAPTTQTIRNR